MPHKMEDLEIVLDSVDDKVGDLGGYMAIGLIHADKILNRKV